MNRGFSNEPSRCPLTVYSVSEEDADGVTDVNNIRERLAKLRKDWYGSESEDEIGRRETSTKKVRSLF